MPRRSLHSYLPWGWFVNIMVFVILAACGILWTANRMQATEDRSEAEPKIRAVLLEQAMAWNKGDLEGFMATYWKSEQLRFYSAGTVTSGWQATLERYRKRYQAEGKEMGKLAFSDLEVEVLAPDAAMARGRWKLTLSKENPEGLFTLLLKKFPEGWKIVHDHTSAAETKP